MKTVVLILCLVFSSVSFAKTVSRVVEVKGNAFVFSPGEKAKSLRFGSKITDLSEVMVEDGSALSLVNSSGHIYHVTGGSLVKFYNGITEIKDGEAWIISKGTTKGLLHTSNSIVKYGEGQFIYSFDNVTGKTQVLVLTGDVKFSNVLEPELSINIPAGHFSLVEQDYENSLPRNPTKVGLSSYKGFKKLFAEFDNLKNSNMDHMWSEKKSKPSRSIASVGDQFSTKSIPSSSNKGKGKLIKFTSYQGRAIASSGAMEYYKEATKPKIVKKKPKPIPMVRIKYFGFSNSKPVVKAKVVKTPTKEDKKLEPKKPVVIVKSVPTNMNAEARTPASIAQNDVLQRLTGVVAPKKIEVPKAVEESNFEESLVKKSQKIKRHSDEVNSLINDLKAYKQDFKKNY